MGDLALGIFEGPIIAMRFVDITIPNTCFVPNIDIAQTVPNCSVELFDGLCQLPPGPGHDCLLPLHVLQADLGLLDQRLLRVQVHASVLIRYAL